MHRNEKMYNILFFLKYRAVTKFCQNHWQLENALYSHFVGISFVLFFYTILSTLYSIPYVSPLFTSFILRIKCFLDEMRIIIMNQSLLFKSYVFYCFSKIFFPIFGGVAQLFNLYFILEHSIGPYNNPTTAGAIIKENYIQ